MSVVLKNTLLAIKGHCLASGRFSDVQIGEPMVAPMTKFCSIYLRRKRPAPGQETTLTGTIDERTISVRIYLDPLTGEPSEDTEVWLDEAASDVEERLLEEYDLGGTVRNVAPAGLEIEYGYQEIQGKMYRLADIAVPVIIDDNATFAA